MSAVFAPVTVDDDFLPTTTVSLSIETLGGTHEWLVGELSLEEFSLLFRFFLDGTRRLKLTLRVFELRGDRRQTPLLQWEVVHCSH